MNREEAKKRLEAFRDYLCAGNPIWDVDECREAFNTAIRSLEAWGEVIKFIIDRIDYWDAPCSGDEAIRKELALAMWEIHKKLKEVEECQEKKRL